MLKEEIELFKKKDIHTTHKEILQIFLVGQNPLHILSFSVSQIKRATNLLNDLCAS